MRYPKCPKSSPFADRLTAKVLMTVLLIMGLTLTVSLVTVYTAMKSETRGRYLGMMNVVSQKINMEIQLMEIGSKNVFDEVSRHLDSPEAVIAALNKEMLLNDYMEGYFAAFEPDYFPEQGRWFEPYIHRAKGGGYRTDLVGSADHDYMRSDWYHQAKTERRGSWTSPYLYKDSKGHMAVYCSYVMPLCDAAGRVVGVCGADLLLDQLIVDLKRIDDESRKVGMMNIDKRYRNLDFYSFIIDRNGNYIAHPERERMMKENIRSFVDSSGWYSDSESVVRNMTGMKSGIGHMKVDDDWVDVYYTPLQSANWSLAIVVTTRVFLQPIVFLLICLLTATCLGQILIWIICRRNIRKETRPLVALTRSADEVAKGNFEAPLPKLVHKDEVADLRNSFASMQQSLVRYIRDLEETTAKKATMENELNVARKIQMSMIPNRFPPFPDRKDIDLFGSLTPAKTVGGDLFDYFIQDDRLFFCIGDVSGKGVPAALMMTVMRYLFRSVSARFDAPERIVKAINDCYSVDNKTMMFCTFFLGVLDLKTGLLRYCNAGHGAPFLVTSEVGQIEVSPNLPVGVVEGMEFTVQEKQLPDGALLFLYTDGLTEATDNEKTLFGKERIEESLRRALADGLTDVAAYVSRMTDDVAAFVKDASQADDLTMLAIRIRRQETVISRQ